MNVNMAMGVIREGVIILLLVSGIMILPSFVATLIISIFQAATQIQEQALTFIPKMVITLLLTIFMGPYIVSKLGEHFLGILNIISGV